MNLPKIDLTPLQRRALINASIASFVTLVLGLAIVAFADGGDDVEPVATPSQTPSPSPSQPACIPSWEVVQSADPADVPNALNGVAVISPAEAWAVGASGDLLSPDLVLLERWDGNAWIAEEGPSPGTERNVLSAVDASEPNDVWAVGRTSSFTGDRPLVVRFDGTAWLQVPLPTDVTGVLNGVEALAPNDVWVVGTTGDVASGANRALVLHWDGELWANVDLGRAGGNGASSLNDITALDGGGELWAVGRLRERPLILRSDGQRWERTESEVGGVTHAVEPVSRDDVWAVGVPIQHLEEGAWVEGANLRAGGQLFSVAAVSPRDVWAVGVRPAAAGATKALVVRYDGQRWRPVEGPGVPGSEALTSVDALDDGTILAVGYRDVELGRRTLAIRGDTCLETSS